MVSGWTLLLLLISTLLISETVSACSSGWKMYNGRCYNFYSDGKTMKHAECYCVSEGGHLVSIHNQRENNLVKDLIYAHKKTHQHVWIGLTYDKKWTDGSEATFFSWARGQPNAKKEDCTLFFRGEWADVKCDKHQGFVCEKSN